MKGTLKPPEVPEKDQSPLVEQLLAFIEHQSIIIQQLKDEIARLKNQPPRPNIKPSRLGKSKKHTSKAPRNKRPGSQKRSKTSPLKIHITDPIEPDKIPTGSQFRYYKDFVVQDIVIQPCNTRFRLKVYETPDGGYVSGTLPPHLNGKHFGPTLIEFILYQYYHCHVTQPLLLEQLDEFDIDISAGQLNNLLIEEKERVHREKDRILSVGLEVSAYINVDDTGARHQGKKDLVAVKDHIWQLYEGLKAYKKNPTPADKSRLNAMFENIFTQSTASVMLNLALKRIYNNKSELLLVLERPDIPLHNNGAENAIREHVKKRKISGGTRSETGRRCRDTFTSLKKTCRKLGVSFWQYLKDRVENVGLIPDLPDLIRQQALIPG